MELTPLDLQNHAVLAAIGEGAALAPAEIAEKTGRDGSNLRKSLKALAEAGRVEEQLNGSGTGRWALKRDGVRVLAALARAANEATPAAAGFVTLEHRQIDADPDQPRKDFGEKVGDGDVNPIEELARSIVLDGLLENLVVRPNPSSHTGDGLPRFVLVAGERRWRAIRWAQEAELLPFDFPIPCNVRDLDEAGVRRVALIENLQRKDLKPLEEARAIEAYRALTDASNADVAGMLNRTPRFVQRRLQLLKLSAEKMKALETGKITLEEAWRWLDNRPTAPELPARQWLIAMEILDQAFAAPLKPDGKRSPTALIECGAAAEEDADRQALATWPTYVVYGPYEIRDENNRRTGRRSIHLSSYGGLEKLQLKFGDDIVTSETRRAEVIAQLRAELGVDFPLAEGPSIEWLKGPFTVAQAVLDEIEAEDAEIKRRSQERQRTEAAEQKRQAEGLAKVQALRAQSRDDQAPAPAASIQDAAAAIGWRLPVCTRPDGTIVDAAGAEILRSNWSGMAPSATLAQRELIAIGINAAAGLATPAYAEPAEDAPPVREFFVRCVADALAEDSEDLADMEDGELADEIALDRANKGLDAFLADEGIEYGEPDYDWSDEGATSLAAGIRVDGLGQAGPDDGATADAAPELEEVQP